MYRYVDREISGVGEAERLLVLAMRDWVAAASRGRCPVDAIMPRMLAHRLIGGLEPFHFVMATLARHGRARFEFGCPCHRSVTEGEAVLLGSFLDGGCAARPHGWLVDAPHAAPLGEAVAAVRAALAMAGMMSSPG
jgi:hypothetical protein